MKCPKCGGFGKIYEHLICDRCNGTGKVLEQTNEEWFASLSTEEKAVFMTLFSLRRSSLYNKPLDKTAADSANEAAELTIGTKKLKAYKELLAWLKGEHKA